MSSGELLLEVRAEEIPARMLPGAARELATRLFEELVARGLMPGEVETGFTPRRLWLVLKDLPVKEKDRPILEIGPPASAAFDAEGRLTPAALGFAKKFGADSSSLKRKVFSKKDELETGTVLGEATRRPVKVKAEGDRIYLEHTYQGRRTREILAELIPSLLRSLSWAKSMKWGSGVGPWVRPVHGVVALFEGEVV
ncbi:MAG TPA: glycine--tRNA ligase subunit beta, partial [Thermoanaerobaculia bacterium]|nr:glycine--tRNA ligase subunit beta [Thermoanaerobaculia bacterium]